MKHVGTVLFLIGCLAAGVLLGKVWLNYKAGPTSTSVKSERPFGGPLPAVRGVESDLDLQSTPDQWKMHAAHVSSMGGTWISVECPSAAFTQPRSAKALADIVRIGHDANLKVMVACRIEAIESNDVASPPSYDSIQPALAAAASSTADLLAIDPRLGETEPADDAWTKFIAHIKETCPMPLCYVADFDGCVRVTWWTQVDYVGIRGPIALTTRPDAKTETQTMQFLANSWRARQDVVASLHLRDNVPVIFLNVGFPGDNRRTEMSYQAALLNARSTANDDHGSTLKSNRAPPWLAGIFFRLPVGQEAAPVEQIIRKDWK